jgi:hypothetical protein
VKLTMFAGGCAGLQVYCRPSLFAVAKPEITICVAVVEMLGVMLTVTVDTPPAARVPIWQVIVDPPVCKVLQPVPVAVGGLCSPDVGKPVAVKTTCDALSPPVLVILKVKVTAVPAGTGLGVGPAVDGVTVMLLLAPILLTKASCEPPLNVAWRGFFVGKFVERVVPTTYVAPKPPVLSIATPVPRSFPFPPRYVEKSPAACPDKVVEIDATKAS